MKMCLHQFVRPTIHIPIEGVGNCMKCTPSEDNKNCKRYCPINLMTVEVKDVVEQTQEKEETEKG